MLNRLLTELFASLVLVASIIGQAQSAQAAPQTADKSIFGLSNLHQIDIRLSKEEWDVLQTSNGRGAAGGQGGTDYTAPDGRLIHVGSGFNGYYPWVHVDLRANGVEIKDAGLRYKGNFSFFQSTAANPLRANLKLKTDLFGGKTSWNGVETLNFHAGVLDPTLTREALAFALFRAAGVPSPRTAYAQITFNVPGIYENKSGGLYTLIENVNKQFLKSALPPGTGLLLKPEGLRGGIQSAGSTWASYIPTYRPDREATPHEQTRVMEFASLVSQADVALFRAKIGSYLDVDEFLRFIAVNSFIVNTDSYINGIHNFYLYLDPSDDKFRFIPWDQDLSMGNRGSGGGVSEIARPIVSNNRLLYGLLDDPVFARRYREILKELATTVFTSAELLNTIEELEKANPGHDPSLKSFIEGRASYLQSLVSQAEK